MENKLDKWLDAAKHQDPVISAKEVGAMISQSPAAKAKISTLYKSIIMGASTTMIALLAYYIFAPTEQTAINNQVVLPPKATTKQQREPQLAKPLEKAINTKVNLNNQWVLAPAKRLLPIDSSVEKTETLSAGSSSSVGGFELDERPTSIKLNLTHEELKALGIITDGSELYFVVTNDSIKTLPNKTTEDQLGFYFRLKVGISGSRNIVSNKVPDPKYGNDENWVSPLVIEMRSDKDADLDYHILHYNVINDQELLFAEKVLPYLVPVEVSLKGKGVMYVHDNNITFWYKNNYAFRKLLPLQYRQSLEQIPNFDEQKLQQIFAELNIQRNKEAEATQLTDLEKSEIQKRFVYISTIEASKLSIQSTNEGLKYKLKLKNSKGKLVKGTIIESGITRKYYTHKKRTYRAHPNDSLQPWFSTDTAFNEIECYHLPLPLDNQYEEESKDFKDAVYFKRMYSSLVPVVILPASNKQKFRPVVLWYYPSKKLEEALRRE